MERLIKDYIKKEYPEYSRCMDIIRLKKDGTYIETTITYKPTQESLFSKTRERKNFRIDIWDIIEYLYHTKIQMF